jgi:hypothetical protein
VNLGDIIPSKIETAGILSKPIIQEGVEEQGLIDRRKTQIYGNVKAMVPLVREVLKIEAIPGEEQKTRYKRGILQPLMEELIFGIVTYY